MSQNFYNMFFYSRRRGRWSLKYKNARIYKKNILTFHFSSWNLFNYNLIWSEKKLIRIFLLFLKLFLVQDSDWVSESSWRVSTVRKVSSWRVSRVGEVSSWRVSTVGEVSSWRVSTVGEVSSWRVSTVGKVSRFKASTVREVCICRVSQLGR